MTKPTVLIVDDEQPLRALAALIVAQEGYHVLEAANGEEALEIAAGRHIDLLLSDIMMPGMSGPELLLRLRDVRDIRRFLFMSGYPAESLDDLRGSNTHIPLLPKPFTAAQLLQSIHRVFAAG